MKSIRLPAMTLMVVCAFVPLTLEADLSTVKLEKNLEKRSRLALENADSLLEVARAAYEAGNTEELKAALAEMQESVELSYQSLVQTGKKPRKNASHYKRGEIGTRQLLRRLDTFNKGMSYLDRGMVEPVMKAIEKIHDSFLLDVMGGGR